MHGHGLYSSTAKTLGRFDKTLEESKKALEVDADTPYPYAHLAAVLICQGNFAEAQRWLQRASERKLMLPDFLMIRHNMAFLQGDNAEMERAGVAAEGMSEIQDWIWGQRAAVLAFSGHLQEARSMSHRAVEMALQADRRESAAQHEAALAVREALFRQCGRSSGKSSSSAEAFARQGRAVWSRARLQFCRRFVPGTGTRERSGAALAGGHLSAV